MRVLVVEREAKLRDAVVAALAGVGHKPVAPTSLAQALVLVAGSYPWDVGVADWAAGDGPGEQAYLRALARRVPLVIAPRPGEPYAPAAYRLGATALVPQPYDLDDLCQLLEAVGTSLGE